MQNLRWSERESEDGDVVFLTEGLGSVGDGVGELAVCSRSAKKHEKRRNRFAHG